VRTRRLAAIAATLLVGAAAATIAVIANGSANAAEQPRLSVVAYKLPIFAGQGGAEGRMAITIYSTHPVQDAVVTFTASEGVSVLHSEALLPDSDPPFQTDGFSRRGCGSIGNSQFTCRPFLREQSGYHIIEGVYTWGSATPFAEPVSIDAVGSAFLTVDGETVNAASPVMHFKDPWPPIGEFYRAA